MLSQHSWVVPVLKSAVLGFAATLLIGAPRTLQATGPEEAAAASGVAQAAELKAPDATALEAGASRVDALDVQSELVPDPDHPSRWLVSMTVANPTDRQITARCALTLERYSGNPMARVSPPPATVWSHREEVEVVAHGSIQRELALPKAVSDAITKTRKAAEAAEAKGIMLPRFVSYGISAVPKPPKTRGAAGATASAPKQQRPAPSASKLANAPLQIDPML